MQIQNRQGTRFILVRHPPAAVPSVPVPFASPEKFLATFTPAQRYGILRRLGLEPPGVAFDPAVQRASVAGIAELARLCRARRIAIRWPGDTALRAPNAGGSAGNGPAKPPPAAPPPTVHPEVVCELVSVEASCSHKGRKANRAGLLEVVPGRDDDMIRLKSTLRGGCGKHSRWEVHAPFASDVVKTGVETSFVAKSWGFKLLGIFEVQPKSYFVNCVGCSGPMKQLEVRAYPIDAWEVGIEINLKEPPTHWKVDVKVTPWEDTSLTLKTDVLKNFHDKAERLKWALDKVMVPLVGKEGGWEFFKTSLKFSGQWAENEADHRVFYKYKAALELDPLVKAHFTIPFGPLAAVPPWIKKWTTDLVGDLYLYLKFTGEVKVAGSWGRTSPDAHTANVEGSGTIGVKAGGNLFLMKKSALNLDVNGSTSITGEAKAPVSRDPEIEYDVKWGGLEIELTIEAAWGLVEYKRKWKPIEGFSLLEKIYGHKPEPWKLMGHGHA